MLIEANIGCWRSDWNSGSLTRLCFTVFLSMYIVLIDVLIYSAAQLQECLINLLTFLFSGRSRTLLHLHSRFANNYGIPIINTVNNTRINPGNQRNCNKTVQNSHNTGSKKPSHRRDNARRRSFLSRIYAVTVFS